MGVDNVFWGAVSLAVLGLLVSVLIVMVTEDLRKAMQQRRRGQVLI
jgi:hypothetical protein